MAEPSEQGRAMKLGNYVGGAWVEGVGGGEELGGLCGLRMYHQRLAVQGRSDRLQALADGAAEVAF